MCKERKAEHAAIDITIFKLELEQANHEVDSLAWLFFDTVIEAAKKRAQNTGFKYCEECESWVDGDENQYDDYEEMCHYCVGENSYDAIEPCHN